MAGGDHDSPHLPRPAAIEAYGDGGFRFGGLSHRGSLLCRPDGIWASDIRSVETLSPEVIRGIIAALPPIDLFIVGTGGAPWSLPAALQGLFRERGIPVDTMTTGAAVRTYNVLLAENRRVASLLIAV